MEAMRKAVMITGVSSGIGFATADLLLKKGYKVFGSVRTEKDAVRLKKHFGENLFYPIIMDVCMAEDVEAAVEKVRSLLDGYILCALVNNAGIALAGPLEHQKIDEIKSIYDVNVFGLINVTRAFLPLLKKRNVETDRAGKVINISSVAGKISAPFLGAYASSKHAVEAISDSFRRELMPYGVDVIKIGPGNVRTPIWAKATRTEEFDHTTYRSAYRNFLDFALEGEKKGMLPEQVATVIFDAVNNGKPSTRYAPVAQKIINWVIPRVLSQRTLDTVFYKTLKMTQAK